VLEGLSARHAALNGTPEGVGELRAILARMRRLLDADDVVGISDENAVLHRKISELGQHRTAQQLTMALNSQLVRFQYRTILSPGRPKRSFAEHTAIVDAIAARNPAAAERAMRRHLSNVVRALSAS
jgi:DNA-binding GntR family transcriptional regulator